MLERIKPLTELVNNMLDSLPKSVWTSDSTTFFDPSIGGGQFVREIERRLRDHGHNDSNIRKRVFGFEKSQFLIDVAINMNNLVGQYKKKPYDKFLEMDSSMKFDVIVGNPPFKNGNETGGASSLWRKVVAKSWTLLKDNGTITMVAPQLPNTSADLGDIFTKHQTTTVWTDVAKFFPGIGSSFYAWAVNKTAKTTTTNFVDDNLQLDLTTKSLPNDLKSISIVDKFLNHPKFECKSSPEYLHTSVADGKDDDHLYSQPGAKHPYVIRRTSGANYQMYGAVEPTDYTASKVVFTFSGNPHYKFHDSSDPIGTIKFQSGHILVKNRTEGENLIKLYETKLYRYVQAQMSSGGMKGKEFYELPKLALNKTWTDADVFAHFNLTQQEIDYINATFN
jgi:hypothetical protein